MSKAPNFKVFDTFRNLPDLSGKKIAIVAMGKSNDQYIMLILMKFGLLM